MLTPIGVTSSAYWDAIKAGNTTHARITFTNQSVVLDDSDIVLSTGISINEMLNGDTDLVFGRSVCKQITTTILNSSKLDGLKWTDEFTLEFGVDIGSPAVTYWVTIGTFSGEKPNNVTSVETIDFTAYDRMTKFDALADEFVPTISYPATVQDIYDALCAFVGMTNVSGDELPNIMSRSYAAAPVEFEGYTCRDILSWIAEASGCYARINADGNVQLVWYSDQSSYSITADEEYNVKTGDINKGLTWDEADLLTWDEIDQMTWDDVGGNRIFEIDRIMVKQVDNDLDINYPGTYGESIYMIVDNPFLSIGSQQDVNNYIAPIFNRMIALGGYRPIQIDCIGNWLVEAGDIISIDVNGETFTYPIFVRTLRWTGAVNDSYETTGQVKRATYTTEANKQKIMNSNEIKMLVGGQFYERQSGIVINQDGVSITGNKSISLDSLGEVDIKANQYYDKWLFDQEGLSFEGHAVYSDVPSPGDYIRFGISPWTGETIPTTEGGIFPVFDDTADFVQMRLKVWKYRANASLSKPEEAFLRLEAIDSLDNNEGYPDEGSMICVYTDTTPDGNAAGWLGQRYSMWRRIYGETVYYYFLESLSSREYKDDIKPMKSYGDAIDKLNPVSFMYKTERKRGDGKGRTSYGLVYEDTVEVLPEICDNTKEQKSINYMSLVPILLKEVQDLRKRVATLEKEIETMKAER